jgi:hypothetical protein
MPIRMSDGTSYCMYREKRHRCKANALASRYACVSEDGQPRGPLDDLTLPSGDVGGMQLSASKTSGPAIPESFMMRDEAPLNEIAPLPLLADFVAKLL